MSSLFAGLYVQGDGQNHSWWISLSGHPWIMFENSCWLGCCPGQIYPFHWVNSCGVNTVLIDVFMDAEMSCFQSLAHLLLQIIAVTGHCHSALQHQIYPGCFPSLTDCYQHGHQQSGFLFAEMTPYLFLTVERFWHVASSMHTSTGAEVAIMCFFIVSESDRTANWVEDGWKLTIVSEVV